MRLLLLSFILSLSAFGDAIVKGSSSGYCGTEIIEQKKFVYEPKPVDVSPPQTCEDFSGTWEGGCYNAVLKCPKVTALGDCIIPTADQIYLDNLKAYGKAESVPLTVTQGGCQTFTVGQLHLDVTTETTGQARIKFRRTCKISGTTHASWERTIDMSLYMTGKRHWDGDRLSFQNDLRGADPNYQAQFRQMKNWRLYHPDGDRDQLRLDYGYFQDQRNYDPKAFEFYSPSFGGQVCIWRKK